jgi:hypothetical protein
MRGAAPALLLLAGLAAAPAQAGPAEIVGKLKAMPASLFDLALARLEAAVGAVGATHGFTTYVFYQDGAIHIAAQSPAAKQDRAACKAIIDQLKLAAGVDPKTGDPNLPASSYASLFDFPEIDQAAVDEAYAETVDGMIAIEVTFARFSESMSCTSKLLSKDIAYAGGATK